MEIQKNFDENMRFSHIFCYLLIETTVVFSWKISIYLGSYSSSTMVQIWMAVPLKLAFAELYNIHHYKLLYIMTIVSVARELSITQPPNLQYTTINGLLIIYL